MPSEAVLRRERLLETGDYFICANCNEIFHYNRGNICEHCDESFCYACHDEHECAKKIEEDELGW